MQTIAIYVASQDINKLLQEDLRLLADNNDSSNSKKLVINPRKSNTACLLFETNQKISKQKIPFKNQYKDNEVIISEIYKELT